MDIGFSSKIITGLGTSDVTDNNIDSFSCKSVCVCVCVCVLCEVERGVKLPSIQVSRRFPSEEM